MTQTKLDQLRQPWFSLYDELHRMWPESDVRILITETRVRVYRNRTLIISRPTLDEVRKLIHKTVTPDGKIKWATLGLMASSTTR